MKKRELEQHLREHGCQFLRRLEAHLGFFPSVPTNLGLRSTVETDYSPGVAEE